MSKKRTSFIIHNDSLDILDELTNEQAGLLFKAVKAYQLGDSIELDTLTKVAFAPFKNQFIRDAEKYEKLCEKNRLIAEARYSTNSTTGRNGNHKPPEPTKTTDNKSDSKSNSEVTKQQSKDCKFNFKQELINSGVDKDIANDWMAVRSKKKAANTKTAFNGFINECKKANIETNYAVKISTENSWAGFKSSWLEGLKRNSKSVSTHEFTEQNYQSGGF